MNSYRDATRAARKRRERSKRWSQSCTASWRIWMGGGGGLGLGRAVLVCQVLCGGAVKGEGERAAAAHDWAALPRLWRVESSRRARCPINALPRSSSHLCVVRRQPLPQRGVRVADARCLVLEHRLERRAARLRLLIVQLQLWVGEVFHQAV